MPTWCGLANHECVFNGLPLQAHCGACVPDSPSLRIEMIRHSYLSDGGMFHFRVTVDLNEVALVANQHSVVCVVSRGRVTVPKTPYSEESAYTLV